MNHYIKQLPDFDFDFASNKYLDIGTTLSRDDGKRHPVARSLVDINFHPSKITCDRLGIPHIDLLPSNILNDVDLKSIPPLHDLELLVPYVVKKPEEFYHIHSWKNDLQKFNPTSVEEMAMFVGLIRPMVRQLFLNTGNEVVFNIPEMNKCLHNGMIVFQEDMMKLLSVVYDIGYESAEALRKSGEFDKYKSLDKDDEDVIVSLHKVINKHLMAKGHCLQVVYIILAQCYMRGR